MLAQFVESNSEYPLVRRSPDVPQGILTLKNILFFRVIAKGKICSIAASSTRLRFSI
jgi:hypothetical protein